MLLWISKGSLRGLGEGRVERMPRGLSFAFNPLAFGETYSAPVTVTVDGNWKSQSGSLQ